MENSLLYKEPSKGRDLFSELEASSQVEQEQLMFHVLRIVKQQAEGKLLNAPIWEVNSTTCRVASSTLVFLFSFLFLFYAHDQ